MFIEQMMASFCMILHVRDVVFFQSNKLRDVLGRQIPSNVGMGFPEIRVRNRSVAHWSHEKLSGSFFGGLQELEWAMTEDTVKELLAFEAF
jgi:hypothetical protein